MEASHISKVFASKAGGTKTVGAKIIKFLTQCLGLINFKYNINIKTYSVDFKTMIKKHVYVFRVKRRQKIAKQLVSNL